MKTFIILLFVAFCAAEKRQASFLPYGLQYGVKEACLPDEEVSAAYHKAYDGFTIRLYQTLAAREANTFATSPLSIWTTLAAIAEGSDYFTQRDLFTLLNLPKELCNRQKFYQIATTRIDSKYNITNSRALVVDDSARVNPQWYDLVASNGLLDVIPAPIRYDAATTNDIIYKIAAPKTQKIDLTGSSVLLNSLDYNGLWNTAFPDTVLERAPFYNAAGERTGYVDLMRVVRKARVGDCKRRDLKLLELTLGEKNEYVIWFGIPKDSDGPSVIKAFNEDSVVECAESLKDSTVPIDIAIPRFSVNVEFNLKDVLRDLGVLPSLWNSAGSTRFISSPAPRPSTYIGRTRVTFTTKGVSLPSFEYPVYRHASIDDLYWSEFIADRPFLFGLFDKETYSCIFTGLFKQPTYPLVEVAQDSSPPVANVSPVNEASAVSASS